MSLDCTCSILTQTLTALLVIEEQIGSPQAIHLHMLQLPKDQVALQYVHYHSRIPGECGQPGRSAIVTSSIMVYSSAGGSLIPSLTSASASDSPCTENLRAPSSGVYSPRSSGEYISPEYSHLSESIIGAQQLNSNL